jgi:hypothetical protein
MASNTAGSTFRYILSEIIAPSKRPSQNPAASDRLLEIIRGAEAFRRYTLGSEMV